MIDTIVFRSVSQVATMFSYVLLVRGMSKVDFGVLSLLYAFLPAIGTFASLGLEQTLRRYLPEYLGAGSKAAASWLVRFVASARFASNAVVLGVLILAWDHFASFFEIVSYRDQFILFSGIVLLSFQARVLQLALSSHMLQRYSVASIAVLSITKLIAYGLLTWLGSFTLQHAILADTVAYGAMYALLRVQYRKTCLPGTTAERYKPGPDERKRLFSYGMYNNFNDAGTFVLGSQSDNFFIAAFINPLSVGIYAFYRRLSAMAAQFLPTQLFQNVIQPMLFAVPQSQADRQIPRFYTFLVNANLLVQCPILAYALAYHSEVVQVIFGGKFIEDSWLLPLVVAFATLNTISMPATWVAQYEEKAAIILVSKAFLAYNVVAMLALLPIAGLYGAAIATGSANFLKNLFIWWHVRRRATWTNLKQVLIYLILIWGGAVVICYGVKSWLHAPPIVQLAFGSLICIGAALVHVRSPAICSSDRTILASLAHGEEQRLLRFFGLLKQAA